MSIASEALETQAPSYAGLRVFADTFVYAVPRRPAGSPAMPEQQFLTVREAASNLGVHENTVRNWINRGILRAVSLPGSGFRRLIASDVERIRCGILGNLAPPQTGPAFDLPADANWDITHEDDE